MNDFMSKRILTGIRANGDIHLGNYLGAIKPMLDISKNLDSSDQFFMFVPDLHSITTEVDYSKLFQTTIDNIKIYLAAGLETNSKIFFVSPKYDSST
ncbi:hypothetical protein HC766_01825 [Candidatus Gracilibacteria bacterium]|nr:hypothetical protein [Candidatus Gracilibacteria bacterium]